MTRRSLLIAAASRSSQRSAVQWLALDLASGTEHLHWNQSQQSVSMGSLLKPFLALAYKATHADWPICNCAGSLSGCWYAKGHGKQDIVHALGNSCNTYFLLLSEAVDRAALDSICLSYGLRRPRRSLSSPNLIGLANGWPQTPREAAGGFARLAANVSNRPVQTVLTGMARCAHSGTARAVGLDCFAKTGTAPCSHVPRELGDGFVVAIYPRDQPRHLLLVQRHGTTGAVAATSVRSLAALET